MVEKIWGFLSEYLKNSGFLFYNLTSLKAKSCKPSGQLVPIGRYMLYRTNYKAHRRRKKKKKNPNGSAASLSRPGPMAPTPSCAPLVFCYGIVSSWNIFHQTGASHAGLWTDRYVLYSGTSYNIRAFIWPGYRLSDLSRNHGGRMSRTVTIF